jgi:hypothetical protein
MPMLRQPRGTYTYGKPRSKTGRRIMLWWHHIVARYLVQQVTGWTAGATSFVGQLVRCECSTLPGRRTWRSAF